MVLYTVTVDSNTYMFRSQLTKPLVSGQNEGSEFCIPQSTRMLTSRQTKPTRRFTCTLPTTETPPTSSDAEKNVPRQERMKDRQAVYAATRYTGAYQPVLNLSTKSLLQQSQTFPIPLKPSPFLGFQPIDVATTTRNKPSWDERRGGYGDAMDTRTHAYESSVET